MNWLPSGIWNKPRCPKNKNHVREEPARLYFGRFFLFLWEELLFSPFWCKLCETGKGERYAKRTCCLPGFARQHCRGNGNRAGGRAALHQWHGYGRHIRLSLSVQWGIYCSIDSEKRRGRMGAWDWKRVQWGFGYCLWKRFDGWI